MSPKLKRSKKQPQLEAADSARALFCVDPEVADGTPHFSGTRTPTWVVMSSLARGTSPEDAAEDSGVALSDVYLAMEAFGLAIPDEVADALHPHEPLEHEFGPNATEVQEIVDRAAELTDDEVDALVEAQAMVSGSERRHAFGEATRVAKESGRTRARVAAHLAGIHASCRPELEHWRHLEAVAAAAEAAVVRDLLDEESLRALAGPWWQIVAAPAPAGG